MSSLGDINSNQEGDDAYVYWIGPFENQKDAGKILTRAKRMGFSDAAMIEQILSKTQKDGYRLRDILCEIVLSDDFRLK